MNEVLRFVSSLDISTAYQILETNSWYLVYVIGIALTLLIIFNLVTSLFLVLFPYPLTDFGFRGKLVYIDEGKERPFIDNHYMISAKPDFIFKIGFNKYHLVEFKKTRNKPSQSHINQSKAACIAVRNNAWGKKFHITHVTIATRGGLTTFSASSNRKLFSDIRKEYKAVKKAKTGYLFPVESSPKCNNCPYKNNCT